MTLLPWHVRNGHCLRLHGGLRGNSAAFAEDETIAAETAAATTSLRYGTPSIDAPHAASTQRRNFAAWIGWGRMTPLPFQICGTRGVVVSANPKKFEDRPRFCVAAISRPAMADAGDLQRVPHHRRGRRDHWLAGIVFQGLQRAQVGMPAPLRKTASACAQSTRRRSPRRARYWR